MIRLHHVPMARSFRTLWLLEELGLDCDVVTYSIRDGSLRAPQFLERAPVGRVPALDIDGLTVFESAAITQYLCERHPEAGLAPAPGEPERTRFLEMLSFAETMAALVEQLNLNHLFLRDPAQASPVVIKLNTRRLEACVAAFEQMLQDQDFVLPSGFSAAETMLGFNMVAVPFYVHLDPYPSVAAYRDRIMARPAFARAQSRDGEQDFYKKSFYPIPEG